MSRALSNHQSNLYGGQANGTFQNPMAAGRGAGQLGANNGIESNKLDVLELLKRKFWFILFFVLLGVGLSLLYFFKVPKTFESTAKIFVDEKNAPSASDKDNHSIPISPVEKYMEVIKSSRILQSAIDEGKFEQMATFKDVQNILYNLREEDILDVLPADTQSESGVIKIAFRGSNKKECQQVLKHVVSSFDDYIKSTTKNLGGETADLVQRMQDQMSGRLSVVNEEIQKLIARPEMLNINGHVVNPYHLRQTQMQDDLHELLRERTQLQARADTIRKSRSSGRNQEVLIADIMKEFNDQSALGSYVATHDQFLHLKVTEQEMLNQFGDQHPDLISIRKQIAMLDNLRKSELSTLQRGQSTGQDAEGTEVIDVFLDLADGKIEMLQSEEASLQKSLADVQKKSQTLAVDVEKLTSLQREREQLEAGYSAIVERLGEIKAYETHLWRNMTLLDPPTPGDQVAPSLPISLAGGILLGGLLGFLFAGFKEIAEKTFHSSEDISSILGVRVVGHIHQFEKNRSRRNGDCPNIVPDVVTLHQPASPPSEAYRAIRTNLFFKAQETGAKIIQVTSPTPGDGKSTTISNIAASIAQSGRRVLLIDADLRRPVQHKLFGIENEVGLSTVIEGDASPMDAVQKVFGEFLHLLPCGPIPANPAELLTSPQFSNVLDEYRENFDFVLIDSPPMLAVTDPSIICNRVDTLYMVMRIRNGVRTNSEQAMEMVESMGVELGGIIVNGLRRRDQKNYHYSTSYGRYNYGSGNQLSRRPKREAVVPQATESIHS